jgi:hypothetical protein
MKRGGAERGFLARIFNLLSRSHPTGEVSTTEWVRWPGQGSLKQRGRDLAVSRPAPRLQRWKVALPACAGLMLIATLLTVWLRPTMGRPVLAEVNGAGLLLERAGQSIRALPGTELQSGDTLRASPTVTAAIGFGPEHTRIILGPDTELRVLSLSRAKRFALGRGKLDASIARQRPFQPMIVRTPQAQALVLGTRFTLTVSTSATRLEVTEGKVRFTRTADGKVVAVTAGNYAEAASNYELLAQPLTGTIVREYWTNLQSDVHMIPLLANRQFPDHPNGRDYLDNLEAPSRWGENYGARIYGYLHPPKTGEYTFWIDAGGVGELWLSWDDHPENRQQVAFSFGELRLQGQPSSPISLIAGRKYFIETRYKQGSKDKDFLRVYWQGPERAREIISGKFLSPFIPQPKKL